MLDSGTFGNSPAAITLVDIINEKNIPHAKIGKTLSGFNLMLNELSKLDTKISVGLAHIIYIDYKSKMNEFPSEVRTFIENLITAKFRIWMKENRGQKPKKHRT